MKTTIQGPAPEPYDATDQNTNLDKTDNYPVAGGSAAAKSVAGQEEKDIAT